MLDMKQQASLCICIVYCEVKYIRKERASNKKNQATALAGRLFPCPF
jgi:hypothetical protein